MVGTNGDGTGDTAERNLISGNSIAGVWIDGQGTDGNVVAGNFVGTSVSGDTALSNGTSYAYGYVSSYVGTAGFYDYVTGGVVITGAPPATGSVPMVKASTPTARRNVISGNASVGVQVSNSGTSGNVVQGNLIGTDPTGTVNLGNGSDGIKVESGAVDNTIGGVTAAAGNLITDNNGPGVAVTGVDSVGDEIAGNCIFANAGPAIDLGGDGVTENYSSPRDGPDNFQNFPIVVKTIAGKLEGWLFGSTPDTRFHIDFFASASYGAGGWGDAEQYLGSLDVTTDGHGRALFDVPYAPPADLPVLTATATDPLGNTSEVASLRQAVAQAPAQTVRTGSRKAADFFGRCRRPDRSGRPRCRPARPGVGPDAIGFGRGPYSLDGLRLERLGQWDRINVLSRQPLRRESGAGGDDLCAAARFSGQCHADPERRSHGASPVQTEVVLSDRVFVVSTTADSGPGSLRQAILDSNATAGGSNTIDFAIPGQGVQTIVAASPLPDITTSVLIDGSSQPGDEGTPLIELSSSESGAIQGLNITGSEVTVRGLGFATDEFTLGASPTADGITLPAVPLSSSSTRPIDQYRIDTSTDGLLIALVHPPGLDDRNDFARLSRPSAGSE